MTQTTQTTQMTQTTQTMGSASRLRFLVSHRPGRASQAALAAAALLAALSLSSSLGCGGGATRRAVVALPSSSQQSTYLTQSEEEPLGSSEGLAAVARGVQRAATAARIELAHDPRLSRVAEWSADHLGEDGSPPPHELVEFLARHVGLVEPVPHFLILGNTDLEALEAGVADSVVTFLARQPYTHFGAAMIERRALKIAIITLCSRQLELEPVARQLAVGEQVRLRGRLLSGYRDATLAVAPPEGPVARRPAGEGQRFDVRIPLEAPGIYRIELLAHGPRGDTVLANFPVYVDVPIPTEVSVGEESDVEDADGDADEVAEALFAMLNETRIRHGLPELVQHRPLAQVAADHSRDMVQAGFVGHTSPTTGSAPDRVRAAGLTSGLILENIGRGYGAREIHRGLMQSPGHRANLLNPDVTHVGLGVVQDPEGSRDAFVATELFVRMARAIDTASAPAILLDAINRGRVARGASPLEAHPNLQGPAANAAEDYLEESELTQEDVIDRASSAVRRFGFAFRRIGGLMVAVSDLREAARLEPLMDPEVRYAGIGIVQGDRAGHPPNSVFVVILLGWAR